VVLDNVDILHRVSLGVDGDDVAFRAFLKEHLLLEVVGEGRLDLLGDSRELLLAGLHFLRKDLLVLVVVSHVIHLVISSDHFLLLLQIRKAVVVLLQSHGVSASQRWVKLGVLLLRLEGG
jgi:hypothetical protein